MSKISTHTPHARCDTPQSPLIPPLNAAIMPCPLDNAPVKLVTTLDALGKESSNKANISPIPFIPPPTALKADH